MVNKLKVLFIAACLGLTGTWPNSGKIYSGSSPVAPSVYSGPGDVVASATAWWGLRAYNNTLANAGGTTTPVVDVRGVTTTTGCTIFLLGNGTGDLDLTTAGGGGVGNQCSGGATTFCTVTNGSCTVSKLYDQSGALACSGATPCDLLQATAADQPTFTFSFLGGHPVLTSGGSPVGMVTTGGPSHAQPNTYVAVAEPNSTTGAEILCSSNTVFLEFDNGSTNIADIFAGSLLTAAAANNTWWSVIGLANGGSSVVYINGSGTSGAAGASSLASPISMFFFANGGSPSAYLTGHIAEAGIWTIGLTSGQASNMSANQRSYWGF